MPACCAPGCKSRSEKDRKHGSKTLFSLPTGAQDSQKREIWLRRINREDIGSLKNLRLCEDHFTSDQYERHRADGLKKLRRDAVPSVFSHTLDDFEERDPDAKSRVRNIRNERLGQLSAVSGSAAIPIPASSFTGYGDIGLVTDSSCEKEEYSEDATPCKKLRIGEQRDHSYSQPTTPDQLEEDMPDGLQFLREAPVPSLYFQIPDDGTETFGLGNECGVSGRTTSILEDTEVSVRRDIEAFTVFIADNCQTRLSEFMRNEKENLADGVTPRMKLPMEVPKEPSVRPIRRDDHSYSRERDASALQTCHLIADGGDAESASDVRDDADISIESVAGVFADSSNGKAEDAAYEVSRLKRLLIGEQKRRRKAEDKLQRVEDSIKDVLAEDQLEMLIKGTMRGSSWSEATVTKALKLRTVCGSRGYEYLKNNCFPLPSERTLQKHIRAKFFG